MSPTLQDGTETAFPGCLWCRHLHGQEGPPRCAAFPDGVPPPIQMGLTDHLEQRTDLGQDENNYVVYEPIERFEEFYPHTLPTWEQRRDVGG